MLIALPYKMPYKMHQVFQGKSFTPFTHRWIIMKKTDEKQEMICKTSDQTSTDKYTPDDV